MNNRNDRKQKKYDITAAAGLLLLTVLLLAGCRRRPETEFTLQSLPESGNAGEQLKEDQAGEQVRAGGQDRTGEQAPTGGQAQGAGQTAAGEPQDGQGQTARETQFCYVHICGEVNRPGVYKLQAGSRVYEAAELAGGFTDMAAQTYVNLAGVLEDGMKIVIPSEEEVRKGLVQTAENAGIYPDGNGELRKNAGEISDPKVNINTASGEQLCTLPGIGESRAESILAYRNAHGGFRTAEEIMNVEGIKEGAYAKIKDKISVE